MRWMRSVLPRRWNTSGDAPRATTKKRRPARAGSWTNEQRSKTVRRRRPPRFGIVTSRAAPIRSIRLATFCRSPRNPVDLMLRILIVGTGSIGERHLRCFQRAIDGQVGFVEPVDERRREVAARYEI